MTVSSYLLWAIAGIQILNAILSLTVLSDMSEALQDAYRGTDAEGAEGFLIGFSVAFAAVTILIAATLVILSIFNNRGKNASRIVTWVVGGLGLCCTSVNLIGGAVGSSMQSGGSGAGMPSQQEVNDRINEALPSWYNPVSITLTAIGLLALLAVIILLALPASNAFFRKPAAGAWDPSQPYPAYPGQPQYPGQTAQPGYGQPGQPAPGLPPYPGQQSPPPPTNEPWTQPPAQGGGDQRPNDPS